MNIYINKIESNLGFLDCVATNDGLYLLKFEHKDNFRDITKITKNIETDRNLQNNSSNIYVINKSNNIINNTQKQLNQFFDKSLRNFDLPLKLFGTDFQNSVYDKLLNIKYSKTISYKTLAVSLNKPTAYRAVAQANANNSIHIIIPCHRVINDNGHLGGYRGGIDRKQFLLDLEKDFFD